MAKKFVFLLFFSQIVQASEVATLLRGHKFQTVFDVFSSTTKDELTAFDAEDLTAKTPDEEIFFSKVTEVITYANRGYIPRESKPYQKLVLALRAALSSDYYKAHAYDTNPPKTVELLQNLCFALYTQDEIKGPYKEITEKMGKMGGYSFPQPYRDPDHRVNLQSSLEIAEAYIKSTPFFRESLGNSKKFFNKKKVARFKDSAKGLFLWGGFDPFISKNIPYRKFTLTDRAGNLLTEFIRMGVPTINNDKKTTRIAPEFIGYLHYLKRHGKKHSYINLQDAREMPIENVLNIKDFLKSIKLNFEVYRVKALHSLMEIEELAETIQVITLSKDSNFYNQRAPFDYSEKPESFLTKYKTILSNSREGYIIPDTWREHKHNKRVELENNIDSLARIFFSDKTSVNCDDKRFFFDLSYALFIDMAQSNSDYMNITCKDGIDRAGSVFGFIYFLHTLLSFDDQRQTHAEFEKDMRHLISVLFCDALAARKREIIGSRFSSFYDSSLYLIQFLKKNPEKRAALKRLFAFTMISHDE